MSWKSTGYARYGSSIDFAAQHVKRVMESNSTVTPDVQRDVTKRADDYVRWVTIACAPLLLIGLVNGLYLPYLHKLNPLYFWLADGLHYIGLLLFAIAILAAKLDLYPRDYGFRSPFPEYTFGEFAFLAFITSFGTLLVYGFS